jgi:hypothetical protein
MDYFTKLFKIQELSERRLLQLRLEETMDNKLYETYKHCPETTLKFLLSIRKLNRISSYELYNSSILEYPDSINKTLDLTEEFYHKYNLTNPDCNNLNNFINK